MKLKKWLRIPQELGFKVTIEPITNVKASAFVAPDLDHEPEPVKDAITTGVTYQRGYRANGRGGHCRRGGVGRKVPTGTTAPRP